MHGYKHLSRVLLQKHVRVYTCAQLHEHAMHHHTLLVCMLLYKLAKIKKKPTQNHVTMEMSGSKHTHTEY
jgi:hypothetical protein